MGGFIHKTGVGEISPNTTMAISYYRDINSYLRLSSRLELNNSIYKSINDPNLPIILNKDAHSNYKSYNHFQFAIRPLIGCSYIWRHRKFSIVPQLNVGIEIPFKASKSLLIKEYGPNQVYSFDYGFESCKPGATLEALLKFRLRTSSLFHIFLEGGYVQTFRTYRAYTRIYPYSNPDKQTVEYNAGRRNPVSFPISLGIEMKLP